MALWRRPDPGPELVPDYSLALAEARRRLDNQLSVVDKTRDRATSLVGVGGLLGTFIGGLGAIQKDADMTPALWTAAGAFGVAVAACLSVLWPRKFHGEMEAEILVKWADDREPRQAQEQAIAKAVAEQVKSNRPKASRIQSALIVVILALAVEFVALGYQLIAGATDA